MATDVRDSPDDSRYEITVDGAAAGFVTYRIHEGEITLVHTEIEDGYEGQGLGSRLATATLEDIGQRGLVLVPVCPFIRSFIQRHPAEYLDLVKPELREKLMSGGRSS